MSQVPEFTCDSVQLCPEDSFLGSFITSVSSNLLLPLPSRSRALREEAHVHILFNSYKPWKYSFLQTAFIDVGKTGIQNVLTYPILITRLSV